jgi:hypothetical protein
MSLLKAFDRVSAQGAAIGPSEYQALWIAPKAYGQPVFGQPGLVLSQRCHTSGRQGNRPAACLGLRRLELRLALDALQRLIDGQIASFQVDVRPPQPQQLAAANAGGDADKDRQVQVRVPGSL